MALKSILPIPFRSGIAQTWLFDVQEHGIEKSKVAQPHNEIQEVVVILTLGVKARIGYEVE
jgi:hypothetical protein